MGEAKRRKASGHAPDIYVASMADMAEMFDTLGDQVGAAVICIGAVGHLTDERARFAARQWNIAERRGIEHLLIYVDGYDDDPRELLQIPEVCDYLKLFVRHAGLTIEKATKLIPNNQGCGVLAACGAFGEHYRKAALATYPG